jgi:hypothetical protein
MEQNTESLGVVERIGVVVGQMWPFILFLILLTWIVSSGKNGTDLITTE